MSDLPTITEVYEDQYRRRVEDVVSRLRMLADDFEKSALRVSTPEQHKMSRSPSGRYTYAAARAVQEVGTGLMNAHIDSAVIAASALDQAEQHADFERRVTDGEV